MDSQCTARADRVCDSPWARTAEGCPECLAFTCPRCGARVPGTHGGTDTLTCDDCWLAGQVRPLEVR